MNDSANRPARRTRPPAEVTDQTEREDTTEIREYAQDQPAAIHAQVEKELSEAWDAT